MFSFITHGEPTPLVITKLEERQNYVIYLRNFGIKLTLRNWEVPAYS